MAIGGRLRGRTGVDRWMAGDGERHYWRAGDRFPPVLWTLDTLGEPRDRASLLVAAPRAARPKPRGGSGFHRNRPTELWFGRPESGRAARPCFGQSLEREHRRHGDRLVSARIFFWCHAYGVSPNCLRRGRGGLCVLDLHFSPRSRSCPLGTRQVRRG